MDTRKRLSIAGLMCVCCLAAMIGAAPVCTSAQSAAQPPIPKPGPLAQPRSLKQIGLPLEQTRAAIPSDNSQTPAKIALGRKLFFDGRLSADGTVACASCHNPERAFTDGKPTSVGIHGNLGQRNAPTILNALYDKAQFWDGRVATLEEQTVLPIVNRVEMGQPNLDAAVARVAAIDEYQQNFRQAFGQQPVNEQNLARALGAYERTLVSFNSPFDRFIAGDRTAIDDAAKRGWDLFNGQARCNKCHALTDTTKDVTLFMDYDFHNIGICIIRHDVAALARQAEQVIRSGDTEALDRAALQTDMSALGRFLVTKKATDTASFKTPGLRNLLMTGPTSTMAHR